MVFQIHSVLLPIPCGFEGSMESSLSGQDAKVDLSGHPAKGQEHCQTMGESERIGAKEQTQNMSWVMG
jgi:hypothetical protein